MKMSFVEAYARIHARFQSGNGVPVERAVVPRDEWEAITVLPVWDNWTPTSENINALPAPLRKYIHDLHTNCDPAGEVRRRVLAEQRVRELEAMIAELKGPDDD